MARYFCAMIFFLVFSFQLKAFDGPSDRLEDERYGRVFKTLRNSVRHKFSSLKPYLEKRILAKKHRSFYVSVNKMIVFLEEEGERSQYEEGFKEFLHLLRSVIRSKSYKNLLERKPENAALRFVQKIAFSFYAQIDLEKYHRKLMDFSYRSSGIKFKELSWESVPKKERKLFGLEKMLSELKLVQHSLKRVKPFFDLSAFTRFKQSYKGLTVWSKFDPNMECSTPSVKLHLEGEGGSSTRFLRLSTPTLGGNRKPKFAPEFLAFLDYLKRKNLHHTYISLQDNRVFSLKNAQKKREFMKAFGVDRECHRAKLLESLNRIPRFKGAIDVVTLSKDSRFYHQSEEFSGDESKEVFLARYFFNLNSNVEGFYIPKSWDTKKKPILFDKMKRLLEILFSEKEVLTRLDKRIFIELSYLVVIDLSQKDSSFMNITCKEGIDRAECVYGFLSLMCFLLKEEEVLEKKYLDNFFMSFFSSALSTKKRAVSGPRFEAFYEAAIGFLSLLKEDPEIISKLGDFYNFKKQELSFGDGE